MATLPILEELPSGYFVEESPGGVLVLHAEVIREFHEAGFGPEQDGELLESELSGRRPLQELETPEGRFVLRRFSHGGLMRWFTGVRFRDPERPFRELLLSDSLRRAGILTPQVVAARARMAVGGGWYLDLLTRKVEDAIDLGYVLGRAHQGEVEVAVLRRLLRSTGAMVRRLHRHGCLHADLTPSNLLVERKTLDEPEPRLWVIDLDRSQHFEDLAAGDRLANLRRLYRYTARRERIHGKALHWSDYLRFLAAYEPERSKRRATWKAIATAHRRNGIFHAAGWLFEAWFGRKVDPREVGGV